MRGLFFRGLILTTLALTAGCTKSSTPEDSSPAAVQARLIEKGRTAYNVYCTSCHNTNFAKDGVLGPAVQGSSLELLRARILNASYPPGYKPKRETQNMVALPHLKNEIEAIHAYVNSAQ